MFHVEHFRFFVELVLSYKLYINRKYRTAHDLAADANCGRSQPFAPGEARLFHKGKSSVVTPLNRTERD